MNRTIKHFTEFWEAAFPDYLVIGIDFELVSSGLNRPPIAVGVFSGFGDLEIWMKADGVIQDWPGIPINIHTRDSRMYTVKNISDELQPVQYDVWSAARYFITWLKSTLTEADREQVIFLHHGELDPTVLLNWFSHVDMENYIRGLIHGFIDTFEYAKAMFPKWPKIAGKYHGAKSFMNHSSYVGPKLSFREHHPLDDAKMIYCTLPYSNNCDQSSHPWRCHTMTSSPGARLQLIRGFLTLEKDQYSVSVRKVQTEPRAVHPYKDWTDLAHPHLDSPPRKTSLMTKSQKQEESEPWMAECEERPEMMSPKEKCPDVISSKEGRDTWKEVYGKELRSTCWSMYRERECDQTNHKHALVSGTAGYQTEQSCPMVCGHVSSNIL